MKEFQFSKSKSPSFEVYIVCECKKKIHQILEAYINDNPYKKYKKIYIDRYKK